MWRSQFEPFVEKSVALHFSVDPVGTDVMWVHITQHFKVSTRHVKVSCNAFSTRFSLFLLIQQNLLVAVKFIYILLLVLLKNKLATWKSLTRSPLLSSYTGPYLVTVSLLSCHQSKEGKVYLEIISNLNVKFRLQWPGLLSNLQCLDTVFQPV